MAAQVQAGVTHLKDDLWTGITNGVQVGVCKAIEGSPQSSSICRHLTLPLPKPIAKTIARRPMLGRLTWHATAMLVMGC